MRTSGPGSGAVGLTRCERVQLLLAGLGPEHAAYALPSLYILQFAIKRTDKPPSLRLLVAI